MKQFNKGFTLIELLTVIAIIAILSAVLFPVFQRAKEAAKKQSDISNMASIHQALKLYRTDQGGYPPLLLQVVEYQSGVAKPVDRIARGYLFRSRIKDIEAFKSSINIAGKSDLVTAFWPIRDPDSNSGNPNDYQAFGNTQAVTYRQLGIDPFFLTEGQFGLDDPAVFYAWDTYDVSPVPDPAGGIRYELRYVRFWTQQAQLFGGGPNDNPRQLGYNDPPDDTVVTWNSYFRKPYVIDPGDPHFPNQPIPRIEKTDLVMLLSGAVKPVDSRSMFKKNWRLGQ